MDDDEDEEGIIIGDEDDEDHDDDPFVPRTKAKKFWGTNRCIRTSSGAHYLHTFLQKLRLFSLQRKSTLSGVLRSTSSK